jgi:adenosylmethionine-8-amino-7-oxononanoate aminotransferase
MIFNALTVNIADIGWMFKDPFSSKGKVRLNLRGVNHARPRSRIGDFSGYDPDHRSREGQGASTPLPWQERRGRFVYVHGPSRGVLLRPLGDVIYFMPPNVITEDEIRLMAEVATEGIERATAQ